MDRQAEPRTLPLLLSTARALLIALLLANLSSCQIVIGVLQIAQGFPKTKCDFTKTTHGRKLTEKDKRVVILSSSVDSARVEVPSLDIDIISAVSRQLKVAGVKVVDDHKVANWIDENDMITTATDLLPLGEHFKADFVVLFTFDDFGYREENSPSLYRGHASGKVVVAELVDDGIKPGKKRARVIYNKPFNSKYPLNRPVSVDQEGPDTFKQKFMTQLGQTLTRLFVDYRPEDEI
ncbi:MAG TPA: hypothetical protein VGH74_20515 [Planctomycetaceae bacterium]|jgi:hypothetical protein